MRGATRPAGRRRWPLVGVAVVLTVCLGAGVIAATGGGGGKPVPPPARAVTAAEADRLAVVRFNNYRATGVGFGTSVTSAAGTVNLIGSVDYRQHLGYAQASGASASFTIEWSASTFVAWPSPAGTTTPPPHLPTSPPSSRPLAPAGSGVDAVLALLLDLGRDRPDNPQLIAQDGARWLRTDTIGEVPVDVLQGPRASGPTASSAPGAPSSPASAASAASSPASAAAAGSSPSAPGAAAAPETGGGPVTYWVDSTGRVLRVDADLGGAPTPTRIDLDPAAFTPPDRAPQLGVG